MNQHVRVDGPEMEFIRIDNPAEGSHAHVERMGIRSTDGHDAVRARELVPLAERIRWRRVGNQGRREGIEQAVQLRGYQCLEFAETIPELETSETLHGPVLPRDVGLPECARRGIGHMRNKRETASVSDGLDQNLRIRG